MQHLPRVLLIEDDRSMAGALAHALQSGYDTDVANSGKLALFKINAHRFDLIILDLNLPDMPGMIVCQHIRSRGITAPILILSGENHTLTKINLLDAGANDYLTKPFSLGELKARLRALVRINHVANQAWGALSAGGVFLNRQTCEVSRDGVAIKLRRKEFALLECLLENAGSVVSRDTLTRVVWQGSDDLWTNTVAVHIKHLRDKLDKPFATPLIRTVHGRGYRLETSQSVVVVGQD